MKKECEISAMLENNKNKNPFSKTPRQRLSWALTLCGFALLMALGSWIDLRQNASLLPTEEDTPALAEENGEEEGNSDVEQILAEENLPGLSQGGETSLGSGTENQTENGTNVSNQETNVSIEEENALPAISDPTLDPVFALPISGETIRDYGYLYDSNTEDYRFHRGLDITCAEGTSVLAAADGVVEAAYADAYWGGVVMLTHENGWRSIYRCVEPLCKEGEEVRQGQVIASVLASAPGEAMQNSHVHFELERDGESQDPKAELSRE